MLSKSLLVLYILVFSLANSVSAQEPLPARPTVLEMTTPRIEPGWDKPYVNHGHWSADTELQVIAWVTVDAATWYFGCQYSICGWIAEKEYDTPTISEFDRLTEACSLVMTNGGVSGSYVDGVLTVIGTPGSQRADCHPAINVPVTQLDETIAATMTEFTYNGTVRLHWTQIKEYRIDIEEPLIVFAASDIGGTGKWLSDGQYWPDDANLCIEIVWRNEYARGYRDDFWWLDADAGLCTSQASSGIRVEPTGIHLVPHYMSFH